MLNIHLSLTWERELDNEWWGGEEARNERESQLSEQDQDAGDYTAKD